ncbi:hypothetical protein [Desulfovibrio litoralis]|uniref:DUF106 domain-containing protein n=1 Tax=Desulfovibrio litoralis DSM 11393 TaxID=1121455 RepID=A0A1M7SQM8_9BACT|nr:hypothetical protein [Desulfovibrio litoralis]SHN60710.1 hypothetical protein SAMN02745728_01152 [Desulfovibrio litoralis DSM 11393]
MPNLSYILFVIDFILIQPYRLFENVYLAFWFGTLCLALLCIIIGKLTQKLLYRLNRAYYQKENDELQHLHDLSIKAANTGDKELFKSVNKMAHDSFGKNFFIGATLFTASLWPLPFALGWLKLHFDGISIVIVPYFNKEFGYAFVMITLYVSLRLLISRISTIIAKKNAKKNDQSSPTKR